MPHLALSTRPAPHEFLCMELNMSRIEPITFLPTIFQFPLLRSSSISCTKDYDYFWLLFLYPLAVYYSSYHIFFCWQNQYLKNFFSSILPFDHPTEGRITLNIIVKTAQKSKVTLIAYEFHLQLLSSFILRHWESQVNRVSIPCSLSTHVLCTPSKLIFLPFQSLP